MTIANALNLPIGAQGQVLVSQGPTTTPIYADPNNASGMVLLATQNHSSVGVQYANFTSIMSATYSQYRILISNLTATTSAEINIQYSIDNGSSYITTNYNWHYVTSTFTSNTLAANLSSTSAYILCGLVANTPVSAIVDLINPENGNFFANILSQHAVLGIRAFFAASGYHANTSTVNAFRVGVSSGALYGNIKVYGSRA